MKMDQQHSKPERKNMDACLRRLKQELVSMKEAGDGLHAQMNSMMGALQELKLLQVQTALESLDISGRPINRGPPQPTSAPLVASPAEPPAARRQHPEIPRRKNQTPPEGLSPLPGASPLPGPRPPRSDSRDGSSSGGSTASPGDPASRSQHRSSLGSSSSSTSSTSSSTSSLESDSGEGTEGSRRSEPEAVPRRWSGYTAPQVNFCGPAPGNPPPEPHPLRPQTLDLPSILYSLSREGPSLDSDYSQDSMDDSSDWTSSLMSQRRNRQPLVLGDNVFADLVGNWLDLPELERGEEGAEAREDEGGRRRRAEGLTEGWLDRPDSPAHPLRLSRSQEISRKFSLTTNIFKKFLRGVRPDRDKLLKERPGWVAPEHPEGDLFKRPKKAAPKSAKGSFYLPFWAAGQQTGKGRPCPQASGLERGHHQPQPLCQQHRPAFSGIYLDRKTPESRSERTHTLFDQNTAVWV